MSDYLNQLKLKAKGKFERAKTATLNPFLKILGKKEKIPKTFVGVAPKNYKNKNKEVPMVTVNRVVKGVPMGKVVTVNGPMGELVTVNGPMGSELPVYMGKAIPIEGEPNVKKLNDKTRTAQKAKEAAKAKVNKKKSKQRQEQRQEQMKENKVDKFFKEINEINGNINNLLEEIIGKDKDFWENEWNNFGKKVLKIVKKKMSDGSSGIENIDDELFEENGAANLTPSDEINEYDKYILNLLLILSTQRQILKERLNGNPFIDLIQNVDEIYLKDICTRAKNMIDVLNKAHDMFMKDIEKYFLNEEKLLKDLLFETDEEGVETSVFYYYFPDDDIETRKTNIDEQCLLRLGERKGFKNMYKKETRQAYNEARPSYQEKEKKNKNEARQGGRRKRTKKRKTKRKSLKNKKRKTRRNRVRKSNKRRKSKKRRNSLRKNKSRRK